MKIMKQVLPIIDNNKLIRVYDFRKRLMSMAEHIYFIFDVWGFVFSFFGRQLNLSVKLTESVQLFH